VDSVQPPLPRNPALEQQLLDDWYSHETWRVYTDWLQQQGVPYGERIALELQLGEADSEARATLEEEIDRLDAAHRTTWMGRELGRYHCEPHFKSAVDLHWWRGLIVGARITSGHSMGSGVGTTELLRALFEAPAARFLSWLQLFSKDAGTEALSPAVPLEGLGRLELRDEVGPLDPWLALAPRLGRLTARGRGISVDTLDHRRLEYLSVESTGLPEPTVRAVGRCRLPNLHTLTVHFGSSRNGAEGSAAMLEDLYTAREVPRLLRLGLMDAAFQDEIAESISRSKLLAQLTHLYLSLGNLTDAGAAAILANSSRFSHLQHLDLSHGFISPGMCERLRAALPMVELRGQRRGA
jgi:hypothetical protein